MLAPLALGGTWRAIIAEVERRINGGRPSLLEELAARAWPAGESERVDGWLLRRTPSVRRRRLNSALPLGRDGAALEEVERFYRGHGMTPLVQVAPAEDLGELDAALHERGWRADGPTDILVAAVDDVPAGRTSHVSVALRSEVHERWLDAWIAAEGRADARETYVHVLQRIPPPAAFAIAHVEGRPAGVGLAVCERAWSGVFCMAVDPATRRRGVARAVLGALVEWSRDRDARGLYLQVECDNAAAHALYASAGFTRSHGYHFRVAP
jgi:ribosomal protein S18 acetylase RimI-like enzyme